MYSADLQLLKHQVESLGSSNLRKPLLMFLQNFIW